MNIDEFAGQEDGQTGNDGEDTVAAFTNMLAGSGYEDAAMLVTIQTSNGRLLPVRIEEPTAIGDIFDAANLTASRDLELYVDGAVVPWDHIVSPGTTITAVGNVKGG